MQGGVVKRLLVLLGVVALVAAGCGDDKDTASTTTTTPEKAVTVQVDNRSDAFNFEAIAYYPDKLTVAPGTEVDFHSNFQGEPHTVTFGASVDKLLGIFDALPDDQKDGPPPPE